MTSPTPLTLQTAKRVVVKIGSSLLVDIETGKLRASWLNALATDIAALKSRDTEVIIVSSGAIALGRRVLGFKRRTMQLEESQASAAVGQIALAHAWQQALAEENLVTAQILLTLLDTENRRRYLNARSTLAALLSRGAIPVVNENDTVATSEIRYGDNDRLAARVASMMSADCLVLLSDVDGLYTSPPENSDATHISLVEEITPEIRAMAGVAATDVGSGGMITKIEAGRIATNAGTSMVIASGRVDHPLQHIENGARCSWFTPRGTPIAARKRWIAGALETSGAVVLDDGACNALKTGKSLLPAGVISVEGRFAKGDAISIRNKHGEELARGLVAYDAQETRHIAGRKSDEFDAILGYRGRDELVHRDDLVLIGV